MNTANLSETLNNGFQLLTIAMLGLFSVLSLLHIAGQIV